MNEKSAGYPQTYKHPVDNQVPFAHYSKFTKTNQGSKKVELGTLAAADVYLVTTVVDLGVVSAVVFGVGWKRCLAERVLKSMA